MAFTIRREQSAALPHRACVTVTMDSQLLLFQPLSLHNNYLHSFFFSMSSQCDIVSIFCVKGQDSEEARERPVNTCSGRTHEQMQEKRAVDGSRERHPRLSSRRSSLVIGIRALLPSTYLISCCLIVCCSFPCFPLVFLCRESIRVAARPRSPTVAGSSLLLFP